MMGGGGGVSGAEVGLVGGEMGLVGEWGRLGEGLGGIIKQTYQSLVKHIH